MQCLACGSTLEVLTEQTRAADEARTFIHTCPKCPLKASKFTATREIPHIHIPRVERDKKFLPTLDNATYDTVHVLSMQLNEKLTSIPKSLEKAMCYNAVGELGNTFKCYTSGPNVGNALREVSRIKVAPFTNLISYKRTQCPMTLENNYVSMKYVIHTGVMFVHETHDVYANVALNDGSSSSVCESLGDLYLLGYAPKTLNGIISASVLGSMSNLTARAYDEAETTTDEYQYAPKADGQRVWFTRVGFVWIASVRLLDHTRICWSIDQSIADHFRSTTGPCIDLELMHKHPPILIDVLMNESGTTSSQQRNLTWIYREFKRLRQMFEYLSIVHIRTFRNSLEEAEADRKTCGYPTDGVVAIHNKGTDMLKLKTVKSVELKLLEDGILSTDDGVHLFKLSRPSPYSLGSIVEVMFKVVDGTLNIEGHFLRTDKRTTNKSDAVHAIVLSTTSKRSPNLLRNQMWRWSNMVRTHVYSRAARMSQDKQIIIDVGTGNGQSVESFPPGKSYILIERSEANCNTLAKRLGLKRNDIKKDPRSIIPIIPRMKRGVTKYHILNTTLEEFLNDSIVRNNIEGLIGCCVCSFSAQFVVGCMSVLRALRIHFVGSCYMYDGVKVGDSIIDSSGLSMRRTSKTTATVIWGKDESYTEPALELFDLPPDTSVVTASDDIPYLSVSSNDPGHVASKHVKILICN